METSGKNHWRPGAQDPGAWGSRPVKYLEMVGWGPQARDLEVGSWECEVDNEWAVRWDPEVYLAGGWGPHLQQEIRS